MPLPTAEALLNSFTGLTALIVGDVMVDSYLWGQTNRISPEAPVPIVNVVKREKRLGGAANVALNVQALGAKPILCSVIGADKDGRELQALMEQNHLATSGLICSADRVTTIKHRIISGAQHLLRIDSETEEPLAAALNLELISRFRELLPQADVVIFEDYDKGVLNSGNIAELIRLANAANVPTVVDPKKKNFLAYKGVSLFKPNLKELKEGLKIELDTTEGEEFEAAVELLRQKLQAGVVLITLSEKGVFYLSEMERCAIAAHQRSIADVSGAGDTVVSVAALCMAAKADLNMMASLANMAGGLVCEQVGVVPISKEQLLAEATQDNIVARPAQ